MSELTHSAEGAATSTPGVLTRGQVDRLLDDFKAFHECEEACNHDLDMLLVHDASLRQIIAQQAQRIQELEGLLEEWKRRKDLWERDARGYASPEEECDKQQA